MTQALRDGKAPRRSIAVTFDDGYADNLHNAKPLLERYDIPATVFVASGYVGRKREFWWDELERLLLQPGKLPETLRLEINDTRHQWQLGKSAEYKRLDYEQHRGWRVNQNGPTPRQSLYYSLWELLCPLSDHERCSVLDQLQERSCADNGCRPTHRPLTRTELLSMSREDLIEVASHTVTHPFLSKLAPAAQHEEIQRSKTSLEEVIGQPVKGFAYPHGDYTTDTVDLVREAGFSFACSTLAASVRRGADAFQLPRLVVEDWDEEQFAERLSTFFRY